MLKCIEKLLKRGKRRKRSCAKNTPWSLDQTGMFKAHNDIYDQYRYEVGTEILRKMVRKYNRGQHLHST